MSKQPTTKLYNILNHGDVFSKNEWSSQGTNNTHKRAFPLQMPLDILRCFPDAKVVMDIYMGSGTTGVACKALGRDFIGVELDENYFDIAKRRIENSTQYLI